MELTLAEGTKVRTTGTVPAVGGAIFAIGEEFEVMGYKRTSRGEIAGYTLGRNGEVVTYGFLDQVEPVGEASRIIDMGPYLSEALVKLSHQELLDLLRHAQGQILMFELMVTARGLDDSETQAAWKNVRSTIFHSK